MKRQNDSTKSNDFKISNGVYTILELNEAIKALIKSEFSGYIWVCGEVQDLKADRNRRHVYLNLVQKHRETSQVDAGATVIIFAGRKFQIFNRFKEAGSDFELKNDIEIKLLCEVDFYPKTGKLSLIAIDVDPFYTLGKIAQNRQQIIEDLKKKGLLDKNKLVNIPDVPLRIGLITACDSAAYHDFANELTLSGFGFKVLACNCHMQGELVEKDVIKALRFFNNLSPQELDLVVITRGGGTSADLSYFDNKKIAEEIALSNLPIVCALGHQINVSIADMAANTFCKTPTKAAQFLVEKVRVFAENISFLEQRIFEKAQDFVEGNKKKLQNITIKIDSVLSRYFRFHHQELLEKKHTILNSSKVYLSDRKHQLDTAFENLKFNSNKVLENNSSCLKNFQDKVKLLDPENILKRGYSITFRSGLKGKAKKALKSIKNVGIGEELETRLFDGRFVSKVKTKNK
ncbi:MAG: exodeoxyribonuclease VII large subunit [Candidatus Omnitrophota bacterium]